MEISMEDYQEMVDSNMGYCTHCGDFTRDEFTEPDARDYPCPECGQNTVVGAEEALMMGLLDLS